MVPEKKDIHADHDAYHREHVKHDDYLSSHRSVLQRAPEAGKSGLRRHRSNGAGG